MSFEIVIKNAVDHGEGPHWDDVTQCLYYVDCIVNDVHRFDSVSGCDSKINLGGKFLIIKLFTMIKIHKSDYYVYHHHHHHHHHNHHLHHHYEIRSTTDCYHYETSPQCR